MTGDRRQDPQLAEKVEMALLTRAAFDTAAATTFWRLSGLPEPLGRKVLARPQEQVRRRSSVGPQADRRARVRVREA